MTSPSKSRINFVALLAAVALFLSTIEYMIPKPLPFMRIGLANLPLLIALALLSNKEYVILAFLKFFGQALISGTIFSYVGLFSLVGTFASALVMKLVFSLFKKRVSLIGVSVAGALSSNLAQIELARYLLFGSTVRFIAFPFLAIGLVSSLILGYFANSFISRSLWYKNHLEGALDG
jgi:heptaprenyl diphosphate synthase